MYGPDGVERRRSGFWPFQNWHILSAARKPPESIASGPPNAANGSPGARAKMAIAIARGSGALPRNRESKSMVGVPTRTKCVPKKQSSSDEAEAH